MGLPRKQRKKYSTPVHPWQKAMIEEDRKILEEYGLKNKKEIYKMRSVLKGFSDQAKQLIASKTPQAEKERASLLKKLQKIGLINKTGTLDNILDLNINDIMDRRLQTFVYKKGLARSINQARQFIVHEHITVGGAKITTPSYFVNADEENSIVFVANSKLNDEEHPERVILTKKKSKKTVKNERNAK